MLTDIYCIWETGVHFPHRIICNTVVLLEISLLHICPSCKPRLILTTEHVDLKFHIHPIIYL